MPKRRAARRKEKSWRWEVHVRYQGFSREFDNKLERMANRNRGWAGEGTKALDGRTINLARMVAELFGRGSRLRSATGFLATHFGTHDNGGG